jgi:hypothetical protein
MHTLRNGATFPPPLTSASLSESIYRTLPACRFICFYLYIYYKNLKELKLAWTRKSTLYLTQVTPLVGLFAIICTYTRAPPPPARRCRPTHLRQLGAADPRASLRRPALRQPARPSSASSAPPDATLAVASSSFELVGLLLRAGGLPTPPAPTPSR